MGIGCPKCGDAHAYQCDSGTGVEFEEWRTMARTMFSDPGLRDTFSATPTWIPTMQREVGLQQFLQQRTQPRPQGALVFQYDGDKVPHFGKLEDLKGRG